MNPANTWSFPFVAKHGYGETQVSINDVYNVLMCLSSNNISWDEFVTYCKGLNEQEDEDGPTN